MQTLNIDLMQHTLSQISSIENASIELQRSCLKSIIENITWDGKDAHINLFGSKSLGEH